MKRKITIILIALLTLCIAVSAVSAWEFSFGGESSSSSSVSTDGSSANVEYNNGKLNINGYEFTIPSGYEQDNNMTLTGGSANLSDASDAKMSRAVFTSGDKTIVVKVIYFDDGQFNKYPPATDNPVNKTISGQEGTLENNDDGSVFFSYLKDGKIIQIDAPDEATITEILK